MGLRVLSGQLWPWHFLADLLEGEEEVVDQGPSQLQRQVRTFWAWEQRWPWVWSREQELSVASQLLWLHLQILLQAEDSATSRVCPRTRVQCGLLHSGLHAVPCSVSLAGARKN